MIAVEELQKAGLRAGRALHAAGLQRRDAMLDLCQIEHQVVRPQAGPPADGRRLRRLQVREAEVGRSRCCLANSASATITAANRRGDHLQPFAHQDQIGVVGDVAARRAQMDDRPGRWAHVAVGMDVGHHVVPQLPFVLLGRVEIDVVDVCPQLGDLLLS